MQVDHARLVGARHFEHIGEDHAFAARVDALTGSVVQAQHDVLRRDDTGIAVRRQKHVVRGQHQCAGFCLRFERQRHVNGHLVAVKVSVERRTDERMQLDRLAFDQYRLERLDAQTVQRRSAVQQHRVLANHFFEQIPD